MAVTVTGFKELEAALNALPKATGRNVLRRVAKGALEPVAARARSLAPVAQGDLSISIAVSEKRTRRVNRFNRFDRDTGIEVAMGPTSGKGVLNYATFAEFGTIDTPSFGYMRGAWNGGRVGALEYVIVNLEREIDKAAKRVARKALRAG
jgi:HK97 gp10 family phage protein